jgi:HAD superfamily hydrolase (TIGR01509 family)
MLKAVLFDLFETLVTESLSRPAGVSSRAYEFGCERESFRKEWKGLRSRVTTGHVTFSHALGRIATELGGHAEEATLQRLCAERARTKAVVFTQIEPQVLKMLDELRSRKLRLAVISNCFVEDVAAWPHCPLASRFHSVVFSCDVGLAKPDPGIYREALRRLRVEASEACFIGDGGDNELSGAEQAGLRAFKALWFLRRWPHWRDEKGSIATMETIDEVVSVVDRLMDDVRASDTSAETRP